MIIGVSGNWLDNEKEQRLVDAYVRCILENGGVPVILPVVDSQEAVEKYCEIVDALLLTGGGDVDPKYWGEELTEMSNKPSEKRDWFDIALTREAMRRGMRILGVCRGMQAIAIISGGSIYQDIYQQIGKDKVLGHSQKMPRSEVSHKVIIDKESRLAEVMGCCETMVNTFHHQAVRSVGENCEVVARAEDGVIEGIEMKNMPVIGVQWHPEELFREHEEQKRLFKWLMNNKL